MGLTDIKKRFFEIRGSCKVIVKYHAYGDYPEREFTELEIVDLVRSGKGQFSDNGSPEAIPDSNLFMPKDDQGRTCKLVLILKEVEIEGKDGTIVKESIIVCSAFRKV